MTKIIRILGQYVALLWVPIPEAFLRVDSSDPYDFGHLKRVMTEVVKIRREIGTVRLSIHAEDSELIRISSEAMQSSSEDLSPLEINNRARPPEAERFALIQAAELANQTNCPINILHLSSKMGLETIADMKRIY